MEARRVFSTGGSRSKDLIEFVIKAQEVIGNSGIKATAPEVIFSEGSSRTWAYVAGKQVGFFEPGLLGDILMEINL
ncbi:hypothetical protein [Chryseobacterium luquanense]|uniref:Uncharacterized protein n=1 Tax=Chryseobacterium luquanense TaxID=2983766 RepID=A0ABT3Y9J7_9FLAO|nr:hypothetical protein [Chryseobacterium luquanense]MCX8534666.1 hypothetical protein [Chryseobacterium luquanense]